ncbi:MAG: polysaccharide biosynthesis protein [Thermoleophilia bacterium]|nr:polysaccharide biosynthesis protein [Thermoleophilia bacterium]
MSTGFDAIPLLKAAPDREQIAERLEGGPWRGLELALAPAHVASEEAAARAARTVREAVAGAGLALTAEAPVSWPSGAFVRVDRLSDEARACLVRSAEFAAAIGSPVLTLHLYAPMPPDEFRAAARLADEAVSAFLGFYARTCEERGVIPLVENVPPVLRMRVGGVFLSPIGGHWRDLRRWHARIPALRFTLDTSHAALFRSFVEAYGTPFGLVSPDELALERYVEELGPSLEVAHVSDAHGILGEGLPLGAGELDLDPVVARLGSFARFVVAEINEPDPARSRDMKAAYRRIERGLARPGGRLALSGPRLRPPAFDWSQVVGRRDPVPSLLELQERFGGRRVLVTGGGGSIGRALTTFLLGFRPDAVTVLDAHEAALTDDRRTRGSTRAVRYALCDVRDATRLEAELAKARPDVVFHLAAYKHVDWAELFPEEFVDTNLVGSWNLLRACERTQVETVVVASTDKAALAAGVYGRTKRLMEQLTAFAARRARAERVAVRFVNVLGTAGSVSELFLRQAREGVPLTVTDTGMLRYWLTMAHAASLAGHAVLLAGEGATLATAADPVTMTVGDLAARIWRAAGRSGSPALELVGIRPGETMSEVLVAPGEEVGEERFQGAAPIVGEVPTAAPAWALERLPEGSTREAARAVWLDALSRPGLLAPTPRA